MSNYRELDGKIKELEIRVERLNTIIVMLALIVAGMGLGIVLIGL
jgi:hypothetical protein